MTNQIAPDDAIWVCCCGKTSIDRYGIVGVHSPGWDESCMMNAVLCKREGIIPGQRVQAVNFYEEDGGQDDNDKDTL